MLVVALSVAMAVDFVSGGSQPLLPRENAPWWIVFLWGRDWWCWLFGEEPPACAGAFSAAAIAPVLADAASPH